MVHITNQMTGLDTRAVADIIPERPLTTLKHIGVPESRICVTNDPGQAEDALRRGLYLVTEDALVLSQLESLEVVVEATGVTEVGTQVAWHSILNKKHVVMLNVETDVTVGIYLHRMAEKTGCVYTAAMGDEPGVCKTVFSLPCKQCAWSCPLHYCLNTVFLEARAPVRLP